MTSGKFWVYLPSLLLYSALAFAYGGADAGNGTDNPQPDAGSAWFLGESRTIKYCYEAAPEFGVPTSIIETTLASAFDGWKQYIGHNQINELAAFSNPGVRISYATRTEMVRRCDGSEDIEFYFGVTNDEISRSRGNFENPTGFAHRRSYDRKLGWGRGFVWIASQGSVDPAKSFPDWTRENALKAVLLHEIGHVFGCEHVRGTIMDESLSEKIATGEWGAAQLGRIEVRKKLWTCADCAFRYVGKFGFNDKVFGSGDDDVETFQVFTGRSPHGPVFAVLSSDENKRNIKLMVADSSGTYVFPLVLDLSHRAAYGGNSRVFSAYLEAGDRTSRFSLLASNAYVFYGSTVAIGQSIPLILEINFDSSPGGEQSGPVSLKFFYHGRVRQLFTADHQ